jgi:ribosomal protein L37AE/L43A
MSMNRVRFQPGLSMAAFLDRYRSEAQCEAALVASRWPDGFVCPACSGRDHSTFVRGGRRYWQCTACRHQCSAISGTVFEAAKLPLTRWFLAMPPLTQAKNNVAALWSGGASSASVTTPPGWSSTSCWR